jgi:hypothetical protein
LRCAGGLLVRGCWGAGGEWRELKVSDIVKGHALARIARLDPLLRDMPACRIGFAFLLLVLSTGPVRGALPAWLAPITQTAQPFIGVTHYQITQSFSDPSPYVLPRELSIHIVEIDPSAPGVSFFGTPGNGADPEEFTRQRTSSFLATHDLAVAINGDFYTTDTGAYASVSGLAMSSGVVTSPAVSGRPSFITRQDDSAVVRTNGTIPSGARNAVSGNQRLISNGVNVTPSGSYTTTLNPHTAIGVDDSNGHIFMMTVDGRQGRFSQGMRTDEMADLLIAFGVDQAINLDGGGSTTLVFADGADGAARVVNSPSDGSTEQQRGTERSVANHFGVYATPNPAYIRLARPPRPPVGAADPTLGTLTVLDAFDGGEGRFASAPFGASGSTFGITSASTADYTQAAAHQGAGSQRIRMVRDGSSSARLRHLSGGGNPLNNRVTVGEQNYALGPQGYVGFFLRTTEVDLQVGIGLDDGVSGGTTGLEASTSKPVIADGRWHLYEWNLADAAQWNSFAGGNGVIGGPNAYIDSIFLFSGASTAGQTIEVFLDTVAYNPHGSLASLVRSPQYAADFDDDGDVDGADLQQWRREFGPSMLGDADGDRDSDGADLLQWQRQVGSGPASLAASVPEPAAWLLALIGVFARIRRRGSVA